MIKEINNFKCIKLTFLYYMVHCLTAIVQFPFLQPTLVGFHSPLQSAVETEYQSLVLITQK